jgi:hypothetical protein
MTKSKTPHKPNTRPINASDTLNILRNLLLKLNNEPKQILVSKRGLFGPVLFELEDSVTNSV